MNIRYIISKYLDGSTGPKTGRDEILSTLEDAIRDVHTRITTREDETLEDERMLIKWNRTLGYLVGQYRQLSRDVDIDEMSDDLALLQTITDPKDER